ncbi:3-oxoacyl-[acyl-carrier-protein] synthase III [Tindallia magadiensis]|uniref:Beta-ketoacyl-[acyl-carrier-protein] synthase III n=1 Tax=Tindallia magadiensis TaxID=69895 RepID=A0A1I3DQR5_9FIRM|nr:beta-ketoacyl-ACP synthase III [Tindallia magadiensis]SFH89080.1 3-oxoacyl-[acyl-carrier-protein] synthase III [Tindallia magadiensis]
MNKKYVAQLTGIGSYVPEQVITNHDLEKIVDTNDEWIQTRTGIQERRKASVAQSTSDLSTIAAEIALAEAGISAESVDAIIVATTTPDMNFPSTACLVQKNIGANHAFAYDVSAACAGFMFALSNASLYIENGMCENILVIGADIMTHITNFADRNTCVLFGDGAGAILLQKSAKSTGLIKTSLGSDGRYGNILSVPAGGTRIPLTEETLPLKKHYIDMNGSEVFKMAVRAMGANAKELLADTGYHIDQVDWLIPHQANKRIIDTLGKKMGIPKEKVFMNLQHYGNMSAASIPVALDEAYRSDLLKRDDLILMVAFGGGLAWGSSLLQWTLEKQ